MPSRKLRTPNSEEPLLLAERFRDASASLELRLWALADSLQPGEHPSVVPGRGVEVVGVREYQPGRRPVASTGESPPAGAVYT